MCPWVYLLPERVFIVPFIRKFLIKKEIGRENLDRKQPYLFAVNHNSHLDEFVTLPAIILSTRRKTHFFADRKHWFEGKLFFRALAHRFSAIPVDRGKGTGDEALLRGARYLGKGHNIIIYPEGTRGSGIEVSRGKVGIAKLALWSGAPVVPVGVWGTHRLMPKGAHKPKFKKIVTVKFGKPISFEEYKSRSNDPESWREVTDKVMTAIAELLDQRYEH
ncbi:MAG: lysophospholipid acyltransferase family protein [Candidatus Thermoplasmatota archaeon]|nr:lysophospholipid acyltransferase family protein [Candidatus Thermoplasmatota archaeon]